MDIYNYAPVTGEFLCEGLADPSPLEQDVWLIPANATDIAPPTAAHREVAVFSHGAWAIRADWRGVELFSTADASPVEIDEIGITPFDIGATETPRPSAFHVWKDGAWSDDPEKHAEILEQVREARWAAIKAERDRLKSSGARVGAHWFHSDADSRIQWLGIKDTARDLLAAGKGGDEPISVLGQDLQWKTLAGDFVNVTVQMALDVVTATKELDARLFAVAEQKRREIALSPDPVNYNVLAGWPASFAE
ncbi:phage tail protein [Cupriavidus plantarum]|uniref:DUF4376 domain-containing protein n=1 Tax=Cupriavidus plantarum TaxID=942865 RepID=UPI000E23245D|nr:phage tail protein [Cupriavidus plantarum]REE92635.1 hypothetical protein C7418_3905 [Cupriavidus plantarum]